MTQERTVKVTFNNGTVKELNKVQLFSASHYGFVGSGEYIRAFGELRAYELAEKHGAQIHAEQECPVCHHTVITSVDPRHDLKVHESDPESLGIHAYYARCQAERLNSGD